MSSFDNAQDKQSHIRNFCVIAHIDHGKSTLCDRLLELTGTVKKRDMQEQILDSNPIERERGITIKLAPVRMTYRREQIPNSKHQILNKSQIQNPNDPNRLGFRNLDLGFANSAYTLNLIDTPGHVDFSYEVSRSLAACEGAILVVDATQGVQAQTIANLAAARKAGLTIIPVINKIDLPNARIEETGKELEDLGFPPITPITPISPILISAKTGQGVPDLLEAIISRIPPPNGAPTGALRSLVFSSHYDPHKGVIVFVRVVDSAISLEGSHPSRLRFLASGAEVTPVEVGVFTPLMKPMPGLEAGEVGYIATGLKDVRMAKVGDTITQMPNAKCKMPNEEKAFNIQHSSFSITPLPGYREPKPMVFLSLFPMNADEFTVARQSLDKLRLSDSAFTFRPISSAALGHGFHCGFLGLLHAEIVQERLSREFGITMLATSPSVEYHVSFARGGLAKLIQSAVEFPDPSTIDEVREPIMEVKIFTPKKYVGTIMQLSQEKRGDFIDMKYFGLSQQHLQGVALQKASEDSEHDMHVELTYLMPLADMIIDFFDRLKSVSEGYASLDYELFDYQSVKLVTLDILVNHEKVDALSFLVVGDQAQRRGREIVERLASVIPRQQFTIPIQAAIGGQIIARADVKAFRKDVIQKLYGGDRTRKDKLLKKQAKGKARMKLIGRVEIPQTAFFEVLKRE